MMKQSCVAVAVLVLFSIYPITAYAALEENPKRPSLVRVFSLDHAVKDTNGDGLADALNAVIVIPDDPSPYHAAAAAELAARLGYQTTALSFPVVINESLLPEVDREIVIRLGLLSELESDIGSCADSIVKQIKPGTGAVIAIGKEGLAYAVVGGDGPGLHEATAQFAARWPNAWEIWGQQTSTRLDQLEEDAVKLLIEGGIADASARLTCLLYEIQPESDKDPDVASEEKRRSLDNMLFERGEIKAAVLRIELESPALAERASEVIEALLSDHMRGKRVELLNYPGIREVLVELHGGDSVRRISIPRFSHPARMLRRRPDPAASRGPKEIKGEDIDLSNLFSLQGLYADGMKDRIPDGIETVIALGPNAGIADVGEFAARLSLECAGMSIPLAAVNPRVDQLVEIKQPVLIGEGIGTDHLIKQGKLHPPALEPGQGYICVVPQAFNKSNAIVVLGDRAGLASALSYLAEKHPGIADHEPSDMSLIDIRKRSELLLGQKNAAGRLLAAAGAVAAELPELKRRSISKLSAEIVIDRALKGYEKTMEQWLGENLPSVKVKVAINGRRDPKTVLEEEKQFEYEVDRFKSLFGEKILPNVGPGSHVDLDIRLSEPREVLTELRTWVEKQLEQKGVSEENLRVRTFCAYKQGFYWLRDSVIPRLRGQAVASLLIKFHPDEPDFNQIYKFYPERTRWLSELYPIDEIIAKELGIGLESIEFEIDEDLGETYSLVALDSDGNRILTENFSPATTSRPYLEQFPDWATVVAQTGWIRAIVNDQTLVDERIATDPEMLWDHYQKEILKKAYDHVMNETGKKPTLDKQPFFHTLQVEAWLSEPDERLGIDEELVSSIESLHEDIYFNTLDFFNGMIPRGKEKLPDDARYTTRTGAPGSVIPLIHPAAAGSAPKAKFTFLGNHAKKNEITLTWTDTQGRDEKKSVEIPKIEPKDVKVGGLITGQSGLEALIIRASLPKPEDIGLLADGLSAIEEGSDPVAAQYLFDHPTLEQVRFELRSGEAHSSLVMVSRGKEKSAEAARPKPAQSGQLVPMHKILSPDDAAEIALSLGTYPGINAYQSGTSYQQRPVYSIELLSPTESTHVSRAKMITAKPTILIVGRQHANEVSATSHILRLAELLATDESYAEYRKRLNIILHPVENPDGAALVEKLNEINPNHMNHAARYTALGVELGTQHDKPDTLLTEALVRPALWDRWLPDVFLNCHGYPTHEWVQQFAGYSPYQFRDYWIPRGWFVYVTHLDDPRHPDHRRAGRSVLKYIDEGMTADPEMAKLNERIYQRYWRWAGRWQPHVINYELHGRTMIYSERRSSAPLKPSARTEITVINETPEQMDETPSADWMGVVVSQGISYLEAHLKMLAEAENVIEEIEAESEGRVQRTFFRKRPPRTQKQD